jgi:hypothetical protein
MYNNAANCHFNWLHIIQIMITCGSVIIRSTFLHWTRPMKWHFLFPWYRIHWHNGTNHTLTVRKSDENVSTQLCECNIRILIWTGTEIKLKIPSANHQHLDQCYQWRQRNLSQVPPALEINSFTTNNLGRGEKNWITIGDSTPPP